MKTHLVVIGIALLCLPLAHAAFLPPPNDMSSSPQPLAPAPSTWTQSTLGSGLEWGEADQCGNQFYSSTVWFSYTAPFDQLVRFTTEGSTSTMTPEFGYQFDTVMRIYESNGDGLGCNDDIEYAVVRTSAMTRQLRALKTYYVQVGGWDGAYGHDGSNYQGQLVLSAQLIT